MYLRFSIGLNLLLACVLIFSVFRESKPDETQECVQIAASEQLQQVEGAQDETAVVAEEENEEQVLEEDAVSESSEEESVTVVTEEEPVVEVGLQPGEISIMVLNGSGVSGVAGRLEDRLEDLGFSDIVAGNASEWGYVESEVRFQPSEREKVDFVLAALGENLGWVIQDEPYGNQITDIVIILGEQFDPDNI